MPSETLPVYIGYDSREAVASDVAAHSIKRRTHTPTRIKYLRHRDLRKAGHFAREWKIDPHTGDWLDTKDGKPFSTEFSHTRFLVPALQNHQGWALFIDSDMIFMGDIKKLFALKDDKYAVMVVKHHHQPQANAIKMDGRLQQPYYRKNWSSFVLWNCAHPANRCIDGATVNVLTGAYMHAFQWLDDHLIGALPSSYNYISGISPAMPMIAQKDGKLKAVVPEVIHYTEGGPWFANCKNVPFGELWENEHKHWRDDGELCQEDA